MREAFADRGYTAAGTLVPRSEPGALLDDPEEVAARVLRLVREGRVTATDGAEVELEADSVCVHGDSPGRRRHGPVPSGTPCRAAGVSAGGRSRPVRPDRMRLLPCGDRAILVEVADAAERRRLDATLRRRPLPGTVEHVPGARTVLVVASAAHHLPAIAAALRDLVLDAPEATDETDELVVEVRYDGPDLDDVATHLGITPSEVVARHTGQVWTVEFAGFAPGFAYLTGSEGDLEVPRRESPRTRIPAGSVGLGRPVLRASTRGRRPAGWQLIGRTDVTLWDPERDPPALLTPGRRVRFVEVVPVNALVVEAVGPLALVEDLGRPGHAVDRGDRERSRGPPGPAPREPAARQRRGSRRPSRSSSAASRSAPTAPSGCASPARRPPVLVDGQGPHRWARPLDLRDGQLLTLGMPPTGLRTYLAVRGGLAEPLVLGSASTDPTMGVGPDPLAPGRRLAVVAHRDQRTHEAADVDVAAPEPPPVTDVVAPCRPRSAGRLVRAERAVDALTSQPWAVTAESDRVGVRLAGPALDRADDTGTVARAAQRGRRPRRRPGAALGPAAGLPRRPSDDRRLPGDRRRGRRRHRRPRSAAARRAGPVPTHTQRLVTGPHAI